MRSPAVPAIRRAIPLRPDNRAGPLGANPITAPATIRQAFTQAQVNASLAANPFASKGGYEGVGTPASPGPAGQTNYGTSTPPANVPTTGNAQKPPAQTGFEDDPILARIRDLATRDIAGAESGALAARQRELIGYGYDPALADQYSDPATAAAAQQNPFSILSQLARGHQSRAHNLDESLNQNNLFYSGARGTALGDEARQYLGEQAGAQGAVQQHLGTIATSLLAARHAAEENVTNGMTDAYNRYLQFHEQYGIPDTTPAPSGGGSSTAGGAAGPSPFAGGFAAGAARAAQSAAGRLPAAAPDPALAALAARSAALNARYGLGKPTVYRGRH